MRRCCNYGCGLVSETLEDTNQGYRVGFGFMLWACREHAHIWTEFDKEDKRHEQKRGEKFQEDFDKWEAEWYENYLSANPDPVPPKYQSSIE